MSSVNKVIILGRLGKDPETRFMTNGESVTNFSIATSESWKDKAGEKQEKTEWHNCVAYKKLAEIINQYVKKGSQLYIEGKLQTRKWEKDGVTRYSTEIIVNEMTMLGGKSGDTQESKPDEHHSGARDSKNPSYGAEKAPAKNTNFDNFDSDVPF